MGAEYRRGRAIFGLYRHQSGHPSAVLFTEEVEVPEISMFQREIDAFLQCVRTGEKERSHIDYAIKTSKIMEGIYESSRCGHEIIFD